MEMRQFLGNGKEGDMEKVGDMICGVHFYLKFSAFSKMLEIVKCQRVSSMV